MEADLWGQSTDGESKSTPKGGERSSPACVWPVLIRAFLRIKSARRIVTETEGVRGAVRRPGIRRLKRKVVSHDGSVMASEALKAAEQTGAAKRKLEGLLRSW